MTKFETECYEALARLKKAAQKGSTKRITRETVGAEAGKKTGAIRPVRHPELCEAIAQTEKDRKSGLLAVNDSDKAEYTDALSKLTAKLEKSEQKRGQLQEQNYKQMEVILNLLNEISILEADKEALETTKKVNEERIDSLMEKIKPKVVK